MVHFREQAAFDGTLVAGKVSVVWVLTCLASRISIHDNPSVAPLLLLHNTGVSGVKPLLTRRPDHPTPTGIGLSERSSDHDCERGGLEKVKCHDSRGQVIPVLKMTLSSWGSRVRERASLATSQSRSDRCVHGTSLAGTELVSSCAPLGFPDSQRHQTSQRISSRWKMSE